MTRKRWILLSIAAVLALAACLPETSGSGRATDAPGDDEATQAARLLYRVYCRNCHGDSARGDGPTAELMIVKPADLTRIAARNGGTFPMDRVMRTIDGRNPLPGHGVPEMPIWGLSLQQLDRDTNQEQEVRQKIETLARYLESLQVR